MTEVPALTAGRITGTRAAHRLQPVKVSYATRVKLPKYHLDPGCTGLEHASDIGTARFASLLALARHRVGRPCRRCTLQPTLDAVLRSRSSWRGQRMLVAFSGQPNPHEGHQPWGFKYRAVTASGAERLEVIAAEHGLLVAIILAKNLRTVTRRNLEPFPTAAEVEVAWGLLCERPPGTNTPDVDLCVCGGGGGIAAFAGS